MNKVGADIIINYSEFGWNEKISLAPEDILDWYRIFRATQEPQFTISATIKGSSMVLPIAGQTEYVLKAMTEDNLIIVLPVTAERKYLIFTSKNEPFLNPFGTY